MPEQKKHHTPTRPAQEAGQLSGRFSFWIVFFSITVALTTAYFGNDTTGKVLLLLSGASVMALALWTLFYTHSKPFIRYIAIAAVALAITSQILNILGDFETIAALPVFNDTFLIAAIRRTLLILGLILFVTALYLAVVDSGTMRMRLHQERNFLARVMEGTSTLICAVKADGTIAYANRAVLETTGKTENDFIGKDWWECFSAVPLSDPQRTFDLFATQEVTNYPLTLKTATGKKRHITWSSNNRYDAKGKIIESFRFGKDTTDRLTSEEERDRLATAIEQAHELVAITDAFGIVQYVNLAFLKTTGYQRPQVIGKPLIEIGGAQYGEELLNTMKDALLKGEVWHAHIQHTPPNKQQLDLHVTVSPIYNPEGRLKGFVATYRDVSNETELEQQLRQAQKMQAIGTLAGGVAHDFNNILSPIIGYTEMAMHEVPREGPAYKYLVNIMDAGLRAKDLVKQILTFSRQTEQERRPIRIAPILREAMKLVRGSLPPTIEIQEDIRTSCPPVLADPTQMHQVLLNLCTNAFHAMEETGGKLTVTLTTERVTPAQAGHTLDLQVGDYCCLTVTDTGAGIEEAVRPRIFEPYFSTKKTGKGYGLGLATVHGIIQSHGGIITTDSKPGKGTTMRVYLPILTTETPVESPIPPPTPTPTGQGQNILLIDDEFPVLQVVKRLLTRAGYEVTACSTPLEALDLFKKAPEQYSLVITDLSMPKMNGIELTKALRNENNTIPVILTTGFNTETLQNEAQEANIQAVALKPLTAHELTTTVHNALHKNPATAQ